MMKRTSSEIAQLTARVAEEEGIGFERFVITSSLMLHPPSDIRMELSQIDLCITNADFVNHRIKPFLKDVKSWRAVKGGRVLHEPGIITIDSPPRHDDVPGRIVFHEPNGGAVKADSVKDPWQLAPWDAFRAIVKVMAFGAKKYEPRNWEKGFDWERLFRATIEHMTAWWLGEDKDPETGMSHLWHAGCCITFLIAHELRGIGKDTRPK